VGGIAVNCVTVFEVGSYDKESREEEVLEEEV
jgi:hypothetical protein